MSVDTAKLRALLATSERLRRESETADEATDTTGTHDDAIRACEAGAHDYQARRDLLDAVRTDLGPLLDELDAARQLARDVLEWGLPRYDGRGIELRDLTDRLTKLGGL